MFSQEKFQEGDALSIDILKQRLFKKCWWGSVTTVLSWNVLDCPCPEMSSTQSPARFIRSQAKTWEFSTLTILTKIVLTQMLSFIGPVSAPLECADWRLSDLFVRISCLPQYSLGYSILLNQCECLIHAHSLQIMRSNPELPTDSLISSDVEWEQLLWVTADR